METEEYIVSVRHDGGKIRFTVRSGSGISGAKALVMSAEGCPECAIENVELKMGFMKELNRMNNVEKGYLLAQLFPEEIKGILDAIEKIHYTLIEDREQIERDWDNGMLNINFWYSLAHEVYSKVTRQGKQLLKCRRFADQLFDGYNAIFTIDCIVKFAERERMGSKFYHMVQVLFIFEPKNDKP